MDRPIQQAKIKLITSPAAQMEARVQNSQSPYPSEKQLLNSCSSARLISGGAASPRNDLQPSYYQRSQDKRNADLGNIHPFYDFDYHRKSSVGA